MPKKGVVKKDGRPAGSGKYKEETILIRVPLTLVSHIDELLDTYIRDGFQVDMIDSCGRIYTITKDA